MYEPELKRMLREMGDDFADRRKRRRGWQQSGQLNVGGSQPVTMQADFGEPDTFTVGFLQPFNATSVGNDIAMRAEALIMWNVEGSYKPVRVSLVGGMSVTATAQGVKVIMTDATPQDANNDQFYANFGQAYQVGCQVSRGTRGTYMNPPYYIPEALATPLVVPDGSFQGFGMPTDAGAQSILICPIASDNNGNPVQGGMLPGQCIVSMISISAQSSLRSNGVLCTYDPVVNNQWVPIIPGCTGVEVFNKRGDGKFIAATCYIGVDG